jgi:hypothetical protein
MADTIKQFAKLYASLVQEKKELENRLVDINQALAGDLKTPQKAASKNGRKKKKAAPKNGRKKKAKKKKAASKKSPKKKEATPKNGRKKKAKKKKAASKKAPKKKAGKRAKNKSSLRVTIINVLGKMHLGKKEILEAVQKAGYKFSTKDPMNSLQVQLYTKFKRDKDGKFHV